MSSRQSTILLLVFIILCTGMLGGILWATNKIASQGIGGEYFWVQWIAIRSKAVDGISPYSITVDNRIKNQVGAVYSWVEDSHPVYTEPLISAIITFPFSLIQDGVTARTLWMCVQLFVLLLSILGTIRLTGWRPAWWFLPMFLLIVLFSFRTLMNWYQGSMIIWVGGLIIGVLLAIKSNRFELAGFLLASTLIKPHIMILWVIFVLIWAGSHRKWRLIFWFISSLVILGILVAFLDPNWPVQYLRILWNFNTYYPSGSPAYAFQQWWPGLGKQMGWALTAILGLILFVEWWLARRREFRWFIWSTCLTLVISPLIGIPMSPEAQYLMILPLLLVATVFDERWHKSGKWVVLIGMLGIFIWEWYLLLSTLGNLGSTRILVLMFPTPVLLLVGLYWVRWWAIRPKRLLIDEMRASEIY